VRRKEAGKIKNQEKVFLPNQANWSGVLGGKGKTMTTLLKRVGMRVT